jgi:hypothetical protein
MELVAFHIMLSFFWEGKNVGIMRKKVKLRERK